MPEEIAEPPAEEKEASKGDQVGVHDPGERLLRETEIGSDRRERDTDDRHVQDDHQVAQAEDEECEPAPVDERGAACGLGPPDPDVSLSTHRLHAPWWRGLPFRFRSCLREVCESITSEVVAAGRRG
jgi:hypothetical protein